MSILDYLYRKSRKWAIALVFVTFLLRDSAAAQLRDRTEHKPADQDQTQAQTNKKPAKRGPRAIGVIEFLPKGGTRLVPIALWIDSRYYDASFYGANPEPIALAPETLYQAMSYGEPTGWFTVTTPKQVNGNWVADGQWKPQSAFDLKVAEQAAKQSKKKASSQISDDAGPPVLRRSPSSSSPESESSGGNQDNAPPPSGGSTPSTQASNPSPSRDDTDRPTLKNSTPPPSGIASRPTLGDDSSPANPLTASPTASSSDENDPDRPVLHRGKPAPQPNTSTAATVAAKPNAATAESAAPAAPPRKASAAGNYSQPGRSYPAISDAGSYETRSLLYAMTPAEKDERGQPMLALALEEVRNFASKRAAAAPAKASAKAPSRPSNFVATDYDLRAFDLDFSNSPTLVLTAKVPAPGGKPAQGGKLDNYFVTVVARVDINGQAQKIFSSVTDDNHLDAFPRLEIIDALDADANGRGDLLFRQHSDTSVSYALYRVYPYQMVKVFEGGAGM